MTSPLSRVAYEASEQARLAPYACLAAASKGREVAEAADPYRTAFQRDRDRIIHSSAFRRLEYKTQVFVNHEGDYYRTRLTHSLEVAQIARAICRSLRLNEEIAEAVALAHDLGHTPFGHAGEDVMNELMAAAGGFEHNYQSHRVVTFLERRYPGFPGLNLTYEVLEGIVKHSGEYDAPRGITGFAAHAGYPNLEGQVVNLADEIAYTNHDLDDGLQSGLLSFAELNAVPLWREMHGRALVLTTGQGEKIAKHQTIRLLMHLCITDLITETARRIQEQHLTSMADVHERGYEIVAFSAALQPRIQALKAYLYTHLYRHAQVGRMIERACTVIRELFRALQRDPTLLPKEYYDRIDGDPQRHICDYIAGMTDRYAFEEHNRLLVH